jgi:hypothetical protein
MDVMAKIGTEVLMRRAGIWLAVALAAAVATYAIILLIPRPDDHFRYRMTVVVGVDGTEVSKSGVIGIERSWTRDYFLRWHHQTKVDGEAVFVDLGSGNDGRPRHIIATLVSRARDGQGQGMADRWPYWGDPVAGTVDLGPAHYSWWEGSREDTGPRLNVFDAAPITRRTELPREHYPLFVMVVNKWNLAGPLDHDVQVFRRLATTKNDALNGDAFGTTIAGSLSSCIAGFRQSCGFSPSSGPIRSCVGIGPAFAATGAGSRAHWEADRRSTRSCAC